MWVLFRSQLANSENFLEKSSSKEENKKQYCLRMRKKFLTHYESLLFDSTIKYGGLFNAHTHLDRAFTTSKMYLEHISMDPIEASSYPLYVKQNLTGDLHRGIAYQEKDLRKRMEMILEAMRLDEPMTRRVDTLIDVTWSEKYDDVGLRALEIALSLKKEFSMKTPPLEVNIGAFNIFGFKDSEPKRWEVFKEGCEKADFIGALPERDAKEGHIGFDENIKRHIKLAQDLGKPLHVHVDQKNDPSENGTETLVEAVRWLGSPEINSHETDNEPSIWAIHAISPSAYDENRFQSLVKNLVKYNIGVIVCPSAAISMKQPREIYSPTHNSIARALEMLVEGVNIRLGTDNISDVFVPAGPLSVFDETLAFANITRFYNPDILAKLATGKPLNNMDRELIRRALL
ncbi:MAG: hypothetical protein QXX38_02190 [Candidatus Aenigmatarchaeota archaeon]